MFASGVNLLNCDNICMCVMSNQFELLEFVFDSVHVDLQYFSYFYCCVVSVVIIGLSEVVLVPYVDAVVAVTKMCILLYLLHVCAERV